MESEGEREAGRHRLRRSPESRHGAGSWWWVAEAVTVGGMHGEAGGDGQSASRGCGCRDLGDYNSSRLPCHDKKHKPTTFNKGQLVLLSTKNLKAQSPEEHSTEIHCAVSHLGPSRFTSTSPSITQSILPASQSFSSPLARGMAPPFGRGIGTDTNA